MVNLFYNIYISVDIAHNEIFRDYVGEGIINVLNCKSSLLSKEYKLQAEKCP